MILNWLIGGPQGTGVDTSANSFARSCAYAGYWIFGKREYHSNITGEHSYFIVTVSDKEIKSFRDPIDVLVSFEERTLKFHIKDVKPGGVVIYDAEIDLERLGIKRDDVVFIPIKYNEIIKETAEKFGLGDFKKLQVMRNSISVFASAGAIDLPAECVIKSMDLYLQEKEERYWSQINLQDS
jgi:2-oxoglutarate ferredoxin oxidoreductase subunit alpha